MINETHKQAQMFLELAFEQEYISGQIGSFSFRQADGFCINKSSFLEPGFIRLNVGENYLYKDANIDAKLHALIYKTCFEAKVVARICKPELLVAASRMLEDGKVAEGIIGIKEPLKAHEALFDNERNLNIYLISEYLKLHEYILMPQAGLIIRARNVDELIAKLKEIILQTRCYLLNDLK